MSFLRYGYVTGPVIGALWLFILATTVSITMSFATGDAFRPLLLLSLILGAVMGLAAVYEIDEKVRLGAIAALTFVTTMIGIGAMAMESSFVAEIFAALALAGISLFVILFVVSVDRWMVGVHRHRAQDALAFVLGDV